MTYRTRRTVHALAYLCGAVAAFSATPLFFMLADRLTVLRWSNEILDLVSRS